MIINISKHLSASRCHGITGTVWGQWKEPSGALSPLGSRKPGMGVSDGVHVALGRGLGTLVVPRGG